jgi:N-acetylglucosaminyldiphosphoundecaprenol N-acetyl-beta-D-mannosaminyltransferase
LTLLSRFGILIKMNTNPLVMGVPASSTGADGGTQRTVVVLGIPFKDVSFKEVVGWVNQRVRSRCPGYIATANMDFIMQAWRDPEQQRILLEADLVVADGIPIVWLSRLMGFGLKERVTGSDLVPMFAELCAREGFSLYGLGGAPGVAEKAMACLAQRYPGLRVAGCYSPPKADVLAMNNAEILSKLDAADPDILLVAFGAPKQEKWVNMHIREWRVPVSIGIGGSLDFLAGAQKRAPRIVQKCALEWLWRMLSDPKRLFKRYFSNLFFFAIALIKLFVLRYGPSGKMPRVMIDPTETNLLKSLHAKRIAFPDPADSRAVEAFHKACADATGINSLVVDIEQRDWLNILEWGMLVEGSRVCRSKGRHFYVLAGHPRAAKAFRFFRLDHYLHTAERIEEIIQAIRAQQSCAGERETCTVSGGRLTLALPTELTAANLEPFRATFEQAWQSWEQEKQRDGVTVDATAIEFLDSAALGFLNALRKQTVEAGLAFRCFGFHGVALQTLKIARLDTLFGEVQEGTERRV